MTQGLKTFNNRKLNRLQEYDYSQPGYYFITLCTKNRQNIFGKYVGADGCRPNKNNGEIKLNRYGLIVDEELKNSEKIRNEIELDQYVIMPNHLHAIIVINRGLSGGRPSAPTGNIYQKQTLSSFVAGFKSVVTKRVNILRNTPGQPVWQRSFYDHVIRNERSLQSIREYIINNPSTWDHDQENINRINTHDEIRALKSAALYRKRCSFLRISGKFRFISDKN